MVGAIIFAYIFLIYGLTKLVVCYLDIILSYEQRVYLLNNTSWFKHMLTLDMSTAGKTLSIIYIVFYFLTVLRNIQRIQTGIISDNLVKILGERLFIYFTYVFIGVILVTLYSLIIYTRIAINKNTQYNKRYKLMGICGGLVFITTAPIMFMVHKIFDHGFSAAIRKYHSIVIISIMLVLLTISVIFYLGYSIIVYDEEHENACYHKHPSIADIIALFAIPTNVL